jgi:hypothetical protein
LLEMFHLCRAFTHTPPVPLLRRAHFLLPRRSVRTRFVRMLGDWLVGLPDRHEWFSRLLPYLLSALADEDPGIPPVCLAYLEALGAMHEAENEKVVLERRQYGVDGDADGRFAMRAVDRAGGRTVDA